MTTLDNQDINSPKTYDMKPIGFIQSCFPEKFGIPRQSLLATQARASLTLLPPYNDPDAVAGLEKISHVWLSFIFHKHSDKPWKPKVRPPRLGGNKTLGVFATRSSFRANSLGLSVVKLDAIDIVDHQVTLYFSGVDLLDGTPIVDIKPYVPYADIVDDAVNAIAQQPPLNLDVVFLDAANLFCSEYQKKSAVDIKSLIIQCLQQDPRPAYQKQDNNKEYGCALEDCNIRWRVTMVDNQEHIEVLDIVFRE